MNYNLAHPFYLSACKNPDHLALFADKKEFTYGELLSQVMRVASWLTHGDKKPARVGIMASRSSEAYIGILAAAWVGAAYVPINLASPEAGIIQLLERSSLDALIADIEGSKILNAKIISACPHKILARQKYVPEDSTISFLTDYDQLQQPTTNNQPVAVAQDTPGYILFTSGSTGVPKGVMISAGSVHHFLNAIEKSYPLTTIDRVAGTTAITFDISVYNMFSAWRRGASLHIIPEAQALIPAKFIKEHQITAWFSVPTVSALMYKMGLLKPNNFPSIKQTFFSGEPLQTKIAAAWQSAAPSSTITNMYGPTEATVMCLSEEFKPGCAETHDCISIGRPLLGTQAAIRTMDDHWATNEVAGELLLSGPQLALGYLDDKEMTNARFVMIDGLRWYKTGDLASRDDNGVFHYLGRTDNQVKVLGYRIELEEIEYHLREVTGCDSVAAIVLQLHDNSPSELVGVLANFSGSGLDVKNALKKRLASYMIPSKILLLPKLPMNQNGKVDRKAILAIIKKQTRA